MADRRIFLDTAATLGERVAARAAWRDGACTWGSDDGTLYQGTAGIALFLAELFAATREQRFADAAEGGLRHALQAAEALPAAAFGFHTGRTGIAYAAARFGEATGDPSWTSAAARVVEPLRAAVPDDTPHDVVTGASGAIPALLRLRGVVDPELATETARALGEHLLRTALPQRAGWGWVPARRTPFNRPLLGISHGASGAGVALAEVHAATGHEAFRYGAERAFAYERAAFDAKEGNWPDYRETEILSYAQGQRLDTLVDRLREGWWPPVRHMTAWCHGAPGIGLARLRAWELLGDDRLREEALAALETTRAWLRDEGRKPAAALGLCHGVAGNAELLLHAAEILGRSELREEAEEIAALRCGADGAGAWTAARETDSTLMLGDAGAGLFLLRLAGIGAQSPLLPRPAVAGAGKPLTGEAYARFSSRDAEAWFGRTLGVLDRLGVSVALLASPPEIACVRAAIQAAIDAEPDAERRSWLEDAVRLEDARAALIGDDVRPIIPFLYELLQNAGDVGWETAEFRLARWVRLVQTRWDWDAWLDAGPDSGLPPPERSAAFAVRVTEWGPEWMRIDPFVHDVLRALGEGATIAALASRLPPAEAATPEDDLPRTRITEALRWALENGLARIRPRGGGPDGPGGEDKGAGLDETGPSSFIPRLWIDNQLTTQYY